jgi:hypothetical protein
VKQAIVWRSIHMPGHEYCSVSDYVLSGTAVFVYQRKPCRLDYLIQCDQAWNTQAARVSGLVGERSIDINLKVEPDRHWLLNGTEQPAVKDCTDVDLNFSPSTNLLPIRRLKLQIGQEAEVNAAWLRFPSFKLKRLDQIYHRLDQTTYRYESGGGTFVAELKVNDSGLVTTYPELWEEETSG